jgi:hypothetical protein
MADVDRRLRGKGYPQNVNLRGIDDKLQAMEQFLDERIRSEIAMWKPKSSPEEWYERNKFWVWAIGILLAIAGLLAKLLSG